MHAETSNRLAEVQLELDPPPINEADTCQRVIVPLLRAAGYSLREIRPEALDTSGSRPDYCVLPELPEMWFLEAKAWNVALNPNHAIQAINYANTRGKRWVVLTNGRTWQLYDNHIVGTDVAGRLTVQVDLGSEGFIALLTALSKISVLNGGIDRFVMSHRLAEFMSAQTAQPKSELMRTIVKTVQRQPGLGAVQPDDIIDYLVKRKLDGEEPLPGLARPDSTALVATTSTDSGSDTIKRLCDVGAADVSGRKPKSLALDPDNVIRNSSWAGVTVGLVASLLDAGPLSLPLYMSKKSKSPLIAVAGTPESQRMRSPRPISASGGQILVETHFSALSHVQAWNVILHAAAVDPSKCLLTVEN